MRYRPFLALSVVLLATCVGSAQEREDRTLLSNTQMRAIINEASGERALHHVLEMVPYPRVRARNEYTGQFRETDAVVRFAQEYGFSNVKVESFPGGGPTWHAKRAELWTVKPTEDKLYDVYDVLVSVASGSDSGDVSAELVDVGVGSRPEDFAGKNVAGKIVLGSASAGQLQRLAVFERGAVGVISYNALRADDIPDQLMSQSVSANAPGGKKPGFGWSVAPRIGRELAQRLARGESITMRSIIEAESFPGELEMVSATIPGDGSTQQAVVVSAHLYEGYTKQGANDDASGCALTLEMGRAYIQLVKTGKLPKPKRTIHFIWVPEISGTTAWLNAHPEIKKTLIANLNFDMDGMLLKLSGGAWVMHRTPDSLPSYLNDLCGSVLKYIADLNIERVRFRSVAYGFTLPVVAPTGSRDPFWAIEEKHYGASDHVVFINQGIPGVMFITWPDHYYHSSQDTPERLDPTQFKRAAVVGIGAMGWLAAADDHAAIKMAAESLARGTERMGEAQKKGLSYLTDLPYGLAPADALKEARVAIRHQAKVEQAVVKSTAELFADPAAAATRLARLTTLIDERAAALEREAIALAALAGAPAGAAAGPTELERLAARTMVEAVPAAGGMGMFGGGGRGGAQADTPLSIARRKLPSHVVGELGACLKTRRSVLDVRDFVSGQFEPVPLADVFEYLKALAAAGQATLTETPEQATGKKAARGKQ